MNPSTPYPISRPNPDSSLEVMLEAYLLALEANGDKPRTISSYRQRIQGFLRFCKQHGILTAKAVDAWLVDNWVVSLRRQDVRWENHVVLRPSPGKLSEATIAGRIQSIKSFFAWCVDRGYLERSPARHLRKPHLNHSADDKLIDLDDLYKIVAVAEEQALAGNLRDLAIVYFIVETGCRVGEVASLQISTLRLDECEAKVTGKSGTRPVDFTHWTAKAIRDWLAVRPRVDHDYVFVGRRGEPLSTNAIYKIFGRLSKKAGVKGRFNPHSIRHLVGQYWTDETNLALAQGKLGHRNMSTTGSFYAHQDRTRVKKWTKRLTLLGHDSAVRHTGT